jgi:predicted methyltransferase
MENAPRRTKLIVLSYRQIEIIVQAKQAGDPRVVVSPDLGLSTVEVRIEPEGIHFPSGRMLSWQDADKILKSKMGCFQLLEDGVQKIQAFSQTTGRAVSLMPTAGAPTMLLAGFPMHRIKDVDPLQDTRLKIGALNPRGGLALDTATGLGYTAIALARRVDRVVSIELDPAVVDVARRNPWSRELFHDPKIERRIEDAYEAIEQFESSSFDWLLHDPPTFRLAGDLYSRDFYREMLRVLKSGGKIFHYVGDLASRSGRSVGGGVVQRLREAGFIRVKRRFDAFGVVASKGG